MTYEHSRNELEPLSMSGDYVASWLDWAQRPESAAMVRYLIRSCRDASAREDVLRLQINSLIERLQQYEPPEKTTVRDPVWTGD